MTLAHDITGEGPTVILIHGVTHRRHGWDAVVPLLAKSRRVVAVDLPAHGDSPGISAEGDALEESLQLLADFAAEVTPAGEKPHLVGNSLGGWAALELGFRGHARSVTAISPAGFFPAPWDQRRAILVFKTLRAVARVIRPLVPTLAKSALGRAALFGVFAARPARWPAAHAVTDVDGILNDVVVDRGLAADFTFSTQADPALPLTIAWGTWDLVLPFYETRLVRQWYPRARFVPLRRLGHVPMTDDPELIARVILEGTAVGEEAKARSGAER